MILIEKNVCDFLSEALGVPAFPEVPEDFPADGRLVIVEKTGESRTDCIYRATVAVQSYGSSMFEAATLCADTIEALLDPETGLLRLDDVTRCELNSDYPFNDTERKRYRYQSVFDIVHY